MKILKFLGGVAGTVILLHVIFAMFAPQDGQSREMFNTLLPPVLLIIFLVGIFSLFFRGKGKERGSLLIRIFKGIFNVMKKVIEIIAERLYSGKNRRF